MDEGHNGTIIGDRINPGFKATKAMVENHDLAGLQALAVRQVKAGADALDFTLRADAKGGPEVFLAGSAPNRSGAEIAGTAKRAALRLLRENGVALDDFTVDVSISAIIADTAGM